MKFHAIYTLSLLALASALPAQPGTIVSDTQGVQLRDGEVCKTTSTEGVLACNDASGASFEIANGERRNLKRDMVVEPRQSRPPRKKGARRPQGNQGNQGIPPGLLRPGEFCSPINNQPGVFGCNDGRGGTFNIVNGRRRG